MSLLSKHLEPINRELKKKLFWPKQMNERFENLMYCAGLTAQGCWDEMDAYDKQSIEKFAELVVRECANQVDWILAEGGKTQGDLIKEHFGVEE